MGSVLAKSSNSSNSDYQDEVDELNNARIYLSETLYFEHPKAAPELPAPAPTIKQSIVQQIEDIFLSNRERVRPSKEAQSRVESMLYYLAELSEAIHFDIQTNLIKYLDPIPDHYFSGEAGSWIYVGTQTEPPESKKSTDLEVLHRKALFIKYEAPAKLEFVYFGEMKDDLFEGEGLLVRSNLIAKGCFSHGKLRDGSAATLVYKCGNYYIGEAANSKPQGRGKSYSFDQGLVSEGEYADGKLNGSGKLYKFDPATRQSELSWEGTFRNNAKCE